MSRDGDDHEAPPADAVAEIRASSAGCVASDRRGPVRTLRYLANHVRRDPQRDTD